MSANPGRLSRRLTLAGVLLLTAATLCGCQTDSMPGETANPIGPARQGDVYLVRGLLGVFSTGMDDLRDQFAHEGIHAVAFQHTESGAAADWIIKHHSPSAGPIILIGHSLGADETISIARTLDEAHVPVALLITLDPVSAGSVPANVRHAVNYYRPNGVSNLLPLFRGVPLKPRDPSASAVANVDLNVHPELSNGGSNHFTIDTDTRLQKVILAQVLSICPPQQPLAAQNSYATPIRAVLSPALTKP